MPAYALVGRYRAARNDVSVELHSLFHDIRFLPGHELSLSGMSPERPPRANLRSQQRAFDEFRREYNNERPHEALQLKTPSTAFAHSPRRYPRPLMRFSTAPWD